MASSRNGRRAKIWRGSQNCTAGELELASQALRKDKWYRSKPPEEGESDSKEEAKEEV